MLPQEENYDWQACLEAYCLQASFHPLCCLKHVTGVLCVNKSVYVARTDTGTGSMVRKQEQILWRRLDENSALHLAEQTQKE